MFQLISQEEALAAIRDVKERLGAKRAFLFGSLARNEQHELSDVDVIFVMDTEKRFHERLGDVWDAYEGDLPIEPLVYTPEEFEKKKESLSLQFMLEGSIEV